MAEKVYDYALTSLARVKDRMKITVSDNDAVLSRLINAATDYIERSCNRRFLSTIYTNEVHQLRGNAQEYLMLKQSPVTALSSLQYRAGSPSNPSWTDMLADYYELVEDGEGGMVRIYGAYAPFFYSGTNALRATYTAGYLIDWPNAGSASHTLPADLSDLCDRMVTRWWKKREHEGKTSESINGSNVTWSSVLDDDDKEILQNYMRQAEFV